MLIRFMIENFRSFKEQQVFSMAAGKYTRHKGHVYNANGKRLLKGSIIYGANASGKTNLLRAMQFGRRIAISGIDSYGLSNQFFRIDNECLKKPGVFQYDFFVNGNVYSYGFAISYDKQLIESEWLYRIEGDHEKRVFERNHGEKITSGMDFLSDDIKNRFEIYASDVPDNKTFLSEIISKKLEGIEAFSCFFDAGKWFSNLIFVFPQTRIRNNEYYDNIESKSNLGRLLKYFDTGIESVSGKELKAEEALSFLPDDLKKEVLSDVSEELNKTKENEKDTSIGISIAGKRFIFTLKNGEIMTSKLIMNHGNSTDYFDLEDESDGTKRLFDLIPLYEKGKGDFVIFIDELDRSFHTKLTQEFIDKFYSVTEGLPSQLICTLHDSNLMDLDLLRQDEIWFVERNTNHASEIFSLNKFKQRYDKDVAKDYLLGRYGAIPCFNSDWGECENDE